MRPRNRLLVAAALIAGGFLAFAPAALAQSPVGNTDANHIKCAQGGGNGPVFGAHSSGDVGGTAALTDPNADHGAAGVLANNSNEAGPGEGGSEGGLGGSSLRGGGAGGCPGPSLPTTGSPISRVAMLGLTFAAFGVPLLMFSRLRPWEAGALRARVSARIPSDRMTRRLRYLEIRERHLGR
jgi:hypothetical protein